MNPEEKKHELMKAENLQKGGKVPRTGFYVGDRLEFG